MTHSRVVRMAALNSDPVSFIGAGRASELAPRSRAQTLDSGPDPVKLSGALPARRSGHLPSGAGLDQSIQTTKKSNRMVANAQAPCHIISNQEVA